MTAATQPDFTCALCGASIGEPTSYYNDLPLCDLCSGMAEEYGERVERRIERLEQRAEKKMSESEAHFARSQEYTRGIPMGQPVLVGHHSEKRHLSALDKSDKAMRRSWEAMQESKRLERSAITARHNSVISADDPLALLKLIEKIAKAERNQERMKAANKVIKNKKLDDAAKVAALIEMGFSETRAAEILHPSSSWVEPGFEGFELTNNNANIRRMKERLADLQRIATQRVEAMQAVEEIDEPTELLPGIGVTRNPLENRLQIVFPGKPSAITRDILKRYGFRWAPSQGAWQRQLTNSAEYALECVKRDLRDLPEYQRATPIIDAVIIVDEYNAEWLYWLAA